MVTEEKRLKDRSLRPDLHSEIRMKKMMQQKRRREVARVLEEELRVCCVLEAK